MRHRVIEKGALTATITPRTITLNSGLAVTLRSARPDDAAALIAYVRAVLAESPHFIVQPDEFNFTEEQERQWIAEHSDGPGKLLLLAEAAGTVVGGLSFENGGHRRIAHRGSLGVSVRQAWRGQGIGAALIAALIAWAEASPLIEKIGLSVFADNAGAIRLYQWLGFVEEGRRSGEMKLGPGQYADEVLMCRWTNRGDAASAADRALHEAALLSEAALGEDWNRPEEDAAWSHLQSGN